MGVSKSSVAGVRLIHSAEDVDAAYASMSIWVSGIIQKNKRPTMFVVPMQGALVVAASVLRGLTQQASYTCVKLRLYDAQNEMGERVNFDYWPISEVDLATYDFIFIDDVGESLRSFAAGRERLAVKGAEVRLLVLVDKPVPHRVRGLKPDFAPLSAGANDWLIGEGMNDGDGVEGQQWRLERGIWAKMT